MSGVGSTEPLRSAGAGFAGAGAGMTVQLAASVLPTYARHDLTLVRGEGSWVYDADGRQYLDLLAGIAVVGLGHCHPSPLAAAQAQLERLWHVSNLYWTEPMLELAARLDERFGGAHAFFCNSGAEAIEAGIKYARKATGKAGIVALEGSFHGRTTGALAATGQPAKRTAFEPLLPGVNFARANDVASLDAAVGPETGCILLEPIQGEGGIHPLSGEFVAAARALADKLGALLLLDEIQTGVGRTGTFFAFEQLGVRPDAVTLAKGLANGLPIGCLLVAAEKTGAFEPGDHANTFGGNPVVSAAALAVLDEIGPELLNQVAAKGKTAHDWLEALPAVVQARGRGLMIGVELDRPAAPVIDACREQGVLVGSAGEQVLRITPPLTIAAADLEHGLSVLTEVLA
jgi:acetylornithine/N-succinyldiaminopimelate aminotransferase